MIRVSACVVAVALGGGASFAFAPDGPATRFSAGPGGVGPVCLTPDGGWCVPTRAGSRATCGTPARPFRGAPWLSDDRCARAGGAWTTDAGGRRHCRGMRNPC
jgi:hypothetical protein